MKFIFILTVVFLNAYSFVSATPVINCGALPGCDDGTGATSIGAYAFIWNLIALLIQYVAVIAVIAIMIGGIMYLISWGEEEKIKKAKSIIIWALVWVLVSIFAWSIINIINTFKI